MNEFGRRAMGYWRDFLPNRYATIPDPEVFFSTLGETIASQVSDLSAAIAGPDPAGEAYLVRVGRGNEAWTAASEAVMAELVYGPNPPEEDEQTAEVPGLLWSPVPLLAPPPGADADPDYQGYLDSFETSTRSDRPTG